MDSVLADLKYAAQNNKSFHGDKGLNVTKRIVLAYMSRIMLFEGTWERYQALNEDKAKQYPREGTSG